MTNTDPKASCAPSTNIAPPTTACTCRARPRARQVLLAGELAAPNLDLRANIFHFHDPEYRPGQRLYLDVGEFWGPDDADRWHARDWYLDLVDVDEKPLELIDIVASSCDANRRRLPHHRAVRRPSPPPTDVAGAAPLDTTTTCRPGSTSRSANRSPGACRLRPAPSGHGKRPPTTDYPTTTRTVPGARIGRRARLESRQETTGRNVPGSAASRPRRRAR